MTTELVRFTQWAKEAPQRRYTSLMGMLCDPAGLRLSFEHQPGHKAAGVDGVRKAEYSEGLEARLTALSAQLRRMAYRPRPARRTYIPKGNGGRRPLGIPCFEDRIVQNRLAGILSAIWEPEFRDCSFGFRPGRNAHQALKSLGQIVTTRGTQWLVEADIKCFFNHVNHEWLMRFLAHRIADQNLLRIIRRFLKAGVMEDGVFQQSDEGTPQGGLVSPVLANIYLHYVLDVWFEKRIAPACRGKAYLVRYADDYVACFTNEADAKYFQEAMVTRLAQFSLEVEPSKTALMRFGSHAARFAKEAGQAKVATFNFLGFTHYAGRSRRGWFMVGRKTQRERMSKKLHAFGVKLKRLRTEGGKAMMSYVQRHLRGHLAYYAVSGNSRSLRQYFYAASRILFKWLNRRSQRRSITWARLSPVLRDWLPRIHIKHNLYPSYGE